MAHRPSSSSITYKWPYDVFLSFYGDDTRLGFISHLYESLHQSGIHAFIDYKIRDGEHITDALIKAIEESRIAIIVFSENYANSTFCLQELEKIIDCFKEESRLIYPVFYYVDPSELRRPRGIYAEALARLEERFKDERHMVEKWREALSYAADLKGCHLKPKIANEQECITSITNEVAARINLKPLHVTNYSVGLESRVKKVISCLDLWWSTKEIKMIGIWGAGGIGKSTIARAVYNSIADNFEGVCFLSDVRKHSEMPNGLSHLQEKLLGRLVKEKDLKLGDCHEGISIIEHRLSDKKILLILDDVDESNQLKALAGSCDWFGHGSRIIITTRNKQLLKSHGIESIYDVKEFNGGESLKLLTWYAFKKENVDSNYMGVFERATHYCCGFPLVLEVIGSYLYGKEVHQWSSALDQFKSIPNRTILNVLKLSFDMLEEVEKQVFLSLACFFNGKKLARANDILLCIHGIQLEYCIGTLVDKSLIKIEQNCITMHDLIEDLGKEIVRQESSFEPGERSRLWFYEDILHVLQQDTGTNNVEAIILDLPESIKVQWSGKELMKMKNLKMLVIRNACFSKSPKYLPNSLRWLEWKGYSFKFLPLRLTQLVYLDLSNSSCEFLQPFDMKFLNLSHMNLTNCKFLQQIPDLFGASNLTELWLDGCTNLTEIHDSVGCLNKLRKLSASGCKKLKILPSRLRLPSLTDLHLNGCSSLQTFPEISIVMKEMSALKLDRIAITELPSSICNLIGLVTLSVNKCLDLKELPASICTLPNLYYFSVTCCTSLTESSKRKVFNKALSIRPQGRNFILSGKEFPKGLHYYNQGSSVSFWVGHVFPVASLCILFKDHRHHVCNNELSVRINGTDVRIPYWKCYLPSMMTDHICTDVRILRIPYRECYLPSRMMMTDHIYMWDMKSVIDCTEPPLLKKWNQVELSIKSEAKEIYLGVHVYNLQRNLKNIQFMDPRRYVFVANLLQKIQEQEDWKDVEEDMNLDSNSTKYVGSLDNPMYYQERDIMEKLRSYWDLEILKVDFHSSYNNLIELHQINCKNCWRIPALGQLPALRTLTIEGLESVEAIGSEFFHGDDSTSFVPFPSLETLHFENMISWEEWNSIAMDAFPKLHTLRIHDCPKLIGNLPRQRLSLKNLEIERCPLLASSIPNCSCLDQLVIIKSPNVVLQELPHSLRRLTISSRQMSEPLFEMMEVEDLIVWDCPDAVPLPVIHMPHSVKGLTIADCENLKFDLVSKASLRYLLRISIYNCKFLSSLFLPNLEELLIKGCPELEPFSIITLSSLKRLEIIECDKLLSRLTELHHLPNITQLCVYFRSVTRHCKRLRHVSSKELQILDSPNIEKIEGEIMPPSLQRLHICDCGFLLEQCRDNNQSIRPEYSHSFRDWEIGTSYEEEDMHYTTLQGLFYHLFRKSSSQYYQRRVKEYLTKKEKRQSRSLNRQVDMY